MSAGDPGRGHKRVKTVIFALLWCFGRGTEGELWQNLGEQFRGGGIRKGTGLELAVKEGRNESDMHRKILWRRKSRVCGDSV